jgi:hypothetical protein
LQAFKKQYVARLSGASPKTNTLLVFGTKKRDATGFNLCSLKLNTPLTSGTENQYATRLRLWASKAIRRWSLIDKSSTPRDSDSGRPSNTLLESGRKKAIRRWNWTLGEQRNTQSDLNSERKIQYAAKLRLRARKAIRRWTPSPDAQVQ